MSAVAIYDLEIPQGATWTQQATWKSGSPSTAVNLTGFSARMQLRKSYSSSSVTIELTTTNGRIALGTTTGLITLSLSSSETENIPAGAYVYDLELIGGGTVTRLLQGTVTVTPEVTR